MPTILNPADIVDETHEDHDNGYLGADGYFVEGGRPISRSDSGSYHHEFESIHVVVPPHREDHVSTSPVVPSRPSSQYSYRPPSQYSYRSPQYLDGAEVAARGYINAPLSTRSSSPALSVRPPSVAGFVASHVYHASRPTSPVRKPSLNASRREAMSSTPASARQSVHNAPPEISQPRPRSFESIRHDHSGMAADFSPVSPAPPKDGLRPMMGIDRYEKHKAVVIQDVINRHVSSPVTTQFAR